MQYLANPPSNKTLQHNKIKQTPETIQIICEGDPGIQKAGIAVVKFLGGVNINCGMQCHFSDEDMYIVFLKKYHSSQLAISVSID